MNTNTATFTATQRAGIEALRSDLAQQIGRPVVTAYDSTDEGQHWAALSMGALDAVSFGRPGPLASILTGAGVYGEAAATASDGSAVAGGSRFAEVLQAAQEAATASWVAIQ